MVWTEGEGSRPTGPLSNDELRAMKARGELRPATIVARGADGPRRPAGQIKGLFTEAEINIPTISTTSPTVRRGEVALPRSPSDVEGLVPWSRSETRLRCEIDRWWMGVGVFLGTMAVLFVWQVFVLGVSGPGWFLLTVLTVLGGMFVHKSQVERRRMVEAALRTDHNIQAAGLIATKIDAARGWRHEFMSLDLPRDSRDSDDTVVTLHSQYLMVTQLEHNLLELVGANEIERIEPQKVRLAAISQSHSTFSSSTSSSAHVSGGYGWGSSSTTGRSDGREFSEEVYGHKLVVATSNPSYPLVTLDFMEDEDAWNFCRAALEQMVAGKGKFDQARVRIRPPEFNRNVFDIRRWFRGEDGRFGWSGLSIQQKLGAIVAGLFLLGLLGGPTLAILLAILVIPGQLITYPLTLAGLPNTTAAMVGLSTVLGGAGAVAFIPGLRGWLDGLLAKRNLRPVLAGALIWPILGQSLMTATILGFESVKQGAVAARQQQQALAAKGAPAGGAPAGGAEAAKPAAPENAGESEWKTLLEPGKGWSAKFTDGVKVSPARLVVVDRDAAGETYVVVIEAEDEPGQRGAFACRLVTAWRPGAPQIELHGQAGTNDPHWPLAFAHNTLVLARADNTLTNSGGFEVDLGKPVSPVLWKRDDILGRLRSDWAQGTEWKGFEKPDQAAAIDGSLVVTDIKNRGENVRVLATIAESPVQAAVFVGKFRETESHPWGYPLVATSDRADYGLPFERGSGLLHPNGSTLYVGYRTDGTLVVFGNSVPFETQSSEKLADFAESKARNLAFTVSGSAWKGTFTRPGEPAEEVRFYILETRNDGALVRARLERMSTPFVADLFVGKLTPDHPGYNLTFDLKSSLPYMETSREWHLRIGPRGEIAGYGDRGVVLDLQPAPDWRMEGARTNLAALKERTRGAVAVKKSYRGTLSKPEDGSSAEVVVEFAPKGAGGNTVQAAVALAAAPQGRVLFEGALYIGDDSLGGYCLLLKKIGPGLPGATSTILGGETDVDLYFRLGLSGDELYGYGKGEVLELRPQ